MLIKQGLDAGRGKIFLPVTLYGIPIAYTGIKILCGRDHIMAKPARVSKSTVVNLLTEENPRTSGLGTTGSRGKVRRERLRQMVLRSLLDATSK